MKDYQDKLYMDDVNALVCNCIEEIKIDLRKRNFLSADDESTDCIELENNLFNELQSVLDKVLKPKDYRNYN
jgi:hypothetical protein